MLMWLQKLQKTLKQPKSQQHEWGTKTRYIPGTRQRETDENVDAGETNELQETGVSKMNRAEEHIGLWENSSGTEQTGNKQNPRVYKK